MTILPIVERELRAAARKKGTYSTRVGVGLGAMVVGGIAGLAVLTNPTVRFGTVFFQTLAGLAMVYCLGAGRFLTADCLSAEKREGTMGLLFLTDLKGYDVVLGKMAATSLNGLYGLLAVLPVLAISLLTGGITNGEYCRVALVLLITFLFSLAIGIFASALTREFRSAMALNFYMLLALAGSLPALAGLLWFFEPARAPAEGWFLPCPVYTLVLAFDAGYKLEPAQFWSSAGLILAMSWLLVALACRIVPRSWQEKPAARARQGTQKEAALRSQARALRNRLLDQNAYYWLAARPLWKARAGWAVIGVALFWLVCVFLSVGWLDESICVVAALMLNGTYKLWITLEAAQSLAEDVRSGAFELLLATPLAEGDIVRGQLLALRRQFLKPLLVVAALELFFMGTLLAGPAHNRSTSLSATFWLWMAGILMLAVDAATLSVVAMAAALTEKNLTRALLKTVRLVLVLPWALCLAVLAIRLAWIWLFLYSGEDSNGWEFGLPCWFGIGVGLDFLFGWKAWRRLTGSFRELALQRFAPAPARAGLRAGCAKAGRAIRERVWRQPRNRKWAAGLAALLVAGSVLAVWESSRSHDPPPEIVLTGPGNGTTLQAVAAEQGVLLVLPDGSLWRWGRNDGTNRAVLPERVGTNRDWKTVSANGSQRLGVRRNGTLWEWQGGGAFTQVGAGDDWVEAVGGPPYKVARKKDGTLWAWGRDVPSRTPVQVGTNRDWIAVELGNTIEAVRSDGTLWGWGEQIGGGGFPRVSRNQQPGQLCAETDWIGFDRLFGVVLARNKAGELWYPHFNYNVSPNPSLSISSSGVLYARTAPASQPSQTINLFRGIMPLYEIHTNSTLWFRPIVRSALSPPFYLVLEAQRADERADWIAVARTPAAAFGLTADGTLWTRGRNLGEEPRVDARSRFEVAKVRAAAALGMRSAVLAMPSSAGPTYPIQEKPRALMKLVPEMEK